MTKLVRPAISRSKRLLNQPFRGRVHAGRGFVEDQDGRVLEQRAGDADALLLADAQFHAAFADVRCRSPPADGR